MGTPKNRERSERTAASSEDEELSAFAEHLQAIDDGQLDLYLKQDLGIVHDTLQRVSMVQGEARRRRALRKLWAEQASSRLPPLSDPEDR